MIHPNDYQVDGTHYRGAPFQHWDLMAQIKADYFTGCATKYLSRYPNKAGLKDLQKARHFAEKLLSTEGGHDYFTGHNESICLWIDTTLEHLDLDKDEALLVNCALTNLFMGMCHFALCNINELIAYHEAVNPTPRYVDQD